MALNPEQEFLSWLQSLPKWQSCILAHLYFLMTSADSGDFAMSGNEALCRFESIMQEPEFLVRRIARLLMVKGVFNFIFYDLEFVLGDLAPNSTLNTQPMPVLATHQWMRCANQWIQLAEGALADESLHGWLAQPEFQ